MSGGRRGKSRRRKRKHKRKEDREKEEKEKERERKGGGEVGEEEEEYGRGRLWHEATYWTMTANVRLLCWLVKHTNPIFSAGLSDVLLSRLQQQLQQRFQIPT